MNTHSREGGIVTRFRTKTAARDRVVEMIARDIQNSAIECQFNVDSLDGDLAKFTINGKVARAIHVFNGYHLPIRLEWFTGISEDTQLYGSLVNCIKGYKFLES